MRLHRCDSWEERNKDETVLFSDVFHWNDSTTFPVDHLGEREWFRRCCADWRNRPKRISMFGWYDVLVLAVVLFAFILYENSQRPVRRYWVAILGTCCVGVSLGLPLFLLMKETNGNQRRGWTLATGAHNFRCRWQQTARANCFP